MKRYVFLISSVCFFFIHYGFLNAQVDSLSITGIKVIRPVEEKERKTWFFISGGYQVPSVYKVPFLPENETGLRIKGDSKIAIPGWFAGIGLMKKTRTKFEVGIMANYFRLSTPIAYAGQNSIGSWVLEQAGSASYFSNNNLNRVSEVYSFRAGIRYKIPLGSFKAWGGIAPGTFSSNVYFTEGDDNKVVGSYRETSLGISFQAGIDYIFKSNEGKERGRMTFFADIAGPKIEEKMISLFEPGWNFINDKGNHVVNPVRIGIAFGIL